MPDTPRGIRNNNPGNIVRTHDLWKGMAADQSTDDRFVVFTAPVWGIRAMARILHGHLSQGMNTVRSLITSCAPPEENNTIAYIDAVSARVGLDPDAQIGISQLVPIMQAITLQEQGLNPYAPAMFEWGLSQEQEA